MGCACWIGARAAACCLKLLRDAAAERVEHGVEDESAAGRSDIGGKGGTRTLDPGIMSAVL